MRKALLTLALVALGSSAWAEELPLNTEFTLKKGDVYTFTPESDGMLSIEFKGQYPDAGLLFSNLYTADFNPTMEMTQQMSLNPNPALGQQSPVNYDIVVYQPAGSGLNNVKVRYEVIGPDQENLLNPGNSLTSIEIKATFQKKASDAEYVPVVSPASGSTLSQYDVNNIALNFEPESYGTITCGSMLFKLYEGENLIKTLDGNDIETNWYYISQENCYMINLQNLLLYHLVDSKINKFTVTLSDFNCKLSGENVNADGEIFLTYNYDELYGIITLEDTSKLPVISPQPHEGTTLTLTYSAPLSPEYGEVSLLGTLISDLNEEPAAKTNVYAPAFEVDGNKIIIDFSDFSQTGPVDDNGNIIDSNGYKAASKDMSLIIRNFVGEDDSLVQPILLHLEYSSTPVEEDPTSVSAIETDGAWDVFNLQGIKVLSTTSFDSVLALPAGIYIINGQKTIVR